MGTYTGGSNLTFEWTDNTGNILGTDQSLIVTTAGNYFFSVYDIDTDCSSPPSAVTVRDLSNGPSAIIYVDPADALDCVVEIIYLSSDEETNVLYTWLINNQPVTTEDIVLTEPGTVLLVALDTITGCLNTDSLAIPDLQQYPFIDPISDATVTCDMNQFTLDASASQQGPQISSGWYDENFELIAENVDQITVSESGTYYYQLVDSDNGCTNTDTIVVDEDFDFPDLVASDDVQLNCNEDQADLSAMTSVINSIYAWSTVDGVITSDATGSNVTVAGSGNYFVSVINTVNQCEALDTIIVLPAITIEGVAIDIFDESCVDNIDGSITIGSPSGGSPPFEFFVNGELADNPTIPNLTAGDYTIQIIDASTCEFDTVVSVEVLDNFEVSLTSEVTVTIGQSTNLTATVDIPADEIATVQWTPSADLSCDTCLVTTLNATPETESTYTVTITDINGCLVEASIRINLERKTTVTFPNIFSPNGNGNDYFTGYASDEGAIITKMQVFDRWGELLWVSGPYPVNVETLGWNGQFKNKDVVPGVYVYYAEILFVDGSSESFSGDVTVIR